MQYHLIAIRDGAEVLNKNYVSRSAAVRAYDRILTALSVGYAKPKQSGVVRLDERADNRLCSDNLKRAEWKLGFGWY